MTVLQRSTEEWGVAWQLEDQKLSMFRIIQRQAKPLKVDLVVLCFPLYRISIQFPVLSASSSMTVVRSFAAFWPDSMPFLAVNNGEPERAVDQCPASFRGVHPNLGIPSSDLRCPRALQIRTCKPPKPLGRGQKLMQCNASTCIDLFLQVTSGRHALPEAPVFAKWIHLIRYAKTINEQARRKKRRPGRHLQNPDRPP